MVLLLVIVLLPLIPAYLLFALLPNSAAVSGPFQGLKINLSGSFAAYFIIFICLVSIRGSFQNDYEKWTVKGRLVKPDGTAEQYVDAKYVTFSVPALRSDAEGNFTFTFLRTADHFYDYPRLHINVPEFQPVTYFLGPKNLRQVPGDLSPMSLQGTIIDVGDINLVPLPKTTNNPFSVLANPGATQ